MLTLRCGVIVTVVFVHAKQTIRTYWTRLIRQQEFIRLIHLLVYQETEPLENSLIMLVLKNNRQIYYWCILNTYQELLLQKQGCLWICIYLPKKNSQWIVSHLPYETYGKWIAAEHNSWYPHPLFLIRRLEFFCPAFRALFLYMSRIFGKEDF